MKSAKMKKMSLYRSDLGDRSSKVANREVIKDAIFADTPQNWLINSKGFYHASCQLVAVIKGNEEMFPNVITDEMYFYHRHSYKTAVYLLSHAIELIFKASISYYRHNICSTALKPPATYGHKAVNMFSDLIEVGYLEKNTGDDEIIELIDTYLKWFGRYYSPNEKQVEKVLEASYHKDDNEQLSFKHELYGAHEKLIAFYDRLSSKIRLGNLHFHYSFQAP